MASFEAVEGFSSRDILGNVRRTAKVLLQQAHLGAAQDREDKGVDALISEHDKLRLEEIKLATELQLSKQLLVETLEDIEVRDESKFITKAEAEVKKLEDDLLSMKLHHFQDNKLLECFQHQEFLMKQTQDLNELPSAIEQQVITLQTKLVSDLLQDVKELERLWRELEANQVERSQTQVRCRELMSKLTQLKYGDDELDSHGRQLNGVGDEDCHSSKTRSQDEVKLYGHTLLCLIGRSGVDWSEDDELCKLVIALGQPSRLTEGHIF